METILLILTVGALCVACFFVGACVGQTAAKGEDIKPPKIDPLKPFREREERQEAKREQERMDAIMRNIDRYDGTGIGQEDIPRG